MKCLDEENIEALVTGFLDEKAVQDAVAHIRQCPTCREAIEKTALVYRALDRVFAAETRDGCPSGEELAGYDEEELNSDNKGRIEQHVKTCVRCAADLHELRTQRQAFVTSQPRQLEKHMPSAAEAILLVYETLASNPSISKWVRKSVQEIYSFLQPIQLACFAPQTEQQKRLAAATGRGFQRQILHRGPSPFQVEMLQFGDEVRLSLSVGKGKPEHSNDIVRLVLSEKDNIVLTKMILVRDGKGGCVLRPEEVYACVPHEQPLSVTMEVIDPSRMLEGTRDLTVIKILGGLLTHADPLIRRSAVELLAESGTAEAKDTIDPLRNDPDEAVRAATARAIQRLSKS